MSENGDAIGGYFPLELMTAGGHFYPDAVLFSSARSAFASLLLAGRPDAVWMPDYICNAMLSVLSNLDIPVKYYSLDERLLPARDLAPGKNEWLLYVNYFGIHSAAVKRVLQQYNPRQVILDYAQAFYSLPEECLATIYSPRKFFGVPDGGLMLTSMPLAPLEPEVSHSLDRTAHLLQRLATNAEHGFAAYQQAEATLTEAPIAAMSRLTEVLLKSIDYQGCKQKRDDNFQYLHQHLKHYNAFPVDLDNAQGALCYPFLSGNNSLREHLAGKRIYTPRYWQDACARLSAVSPEYHLVNNLIPLPVDQRYSLKEMDFIINIVSDFLQKT